MKAKEINKRHHSVHTGKTFQAKVEYARKQIKKGNATIGTDDYKGRKMQSISFHKEDYKFHLPLNILKL